MIWNAFVMDCACWNRIVRYSKISWIVCKTVCKRLILWWVYGISWRAWGQFYLKNSYKIKENSQKLQENEKGWTGEGEYPFHAFSIGQSCEISDTNSSPTGMIWCFDVGMLIHRKDQTFPLFRKYWHHFWVKICFFIHHWLTIIKVSGDQYKEFVSVWK